MPYGRIVTYTSESDESDYGSAIQINDRPRRRGKTLVVENDGRSHRSRSRRREVFTDRRESPSNKNTINLTIPQTRNRAASTGAAPQPNIFFLNPNEGRDRSRSKSRERIRVQIDEDSDRSSGRRSRRSRGEFDMEQMARLKLKDEQREWEDRQRILELELEKRRREEKDAEANYAAKYEARLRREEEERKLEALKWERSQADKKAKEEELIARAEAKRKKEEQEAEEYRKQVIMEEQAKADRKKREREEEERRILLEAEMKKDKKKREEEETRLRVLREEEIRIEKEKAKKKEEDEKFNLRVKETFMKAGYDPDYIEDILEEKRKKRDVLARRTSKREAEMALDLRRPTYIRVRKVHLHPETLEYYRLPWEYDPEDSDYILIKEYVSHELQQELFVHSAKIIKQRKERKYITSGIEKETITTLRPSNVFKNDKDEMFLVRRKSVSKSPNRRSWMFT